MANKPPTRSEFLDLKQAQAQTSEQFSERFNEIVNLVEKQEFKNQNVTYLVLFAFVAIVVTVAIEVLVSNRYEQSSYQGINDRIMNINEKLYELENKIELLKIRNPYLK